MLRRMRWVLVALVCAGIAAWSLANRGQPDRGEAAEDAVGEVAGSTLAGTTADAGTPSAGTVAPSGEMAPSTSVDDGKRAAYCQHASEDGVELAELAALLDSAGVDADPELFELRWGRFLTLLTEYWDQAPTAEVEEAWRSLAAPYYGIEPAVRAAGYDLGEVPVGEVSRFAQGVASPGFTAAKQVVGASWPTYCGVAVPFPAP